MSQDPMDRQLVEAVLAATPRRRRAAAAEVKAVNAASKAAGAVAVIDEDVEDDDLDLGADPDVPELVVAEEDLVGASMDATGEASADAELAHHGPAPGGQVMQARFVLQWLVGTIDPLPLVSHRLGLEEVGRALELQRRGESMKAVIIP